MATAASTNETRAADLIAAARAMAPVVAGRAARCEELRRLPPETEQDFRDAGFYRVLQPARYGGMELDYGIQTELAMEVARGCAASGWNLGVVACHGWILGMFPGEAQEDIWGARPDATISSSFLPLGAPTIERGKGGYRIKGRWGFSSGSDYCQAAILMGAVDRQGAEGREPAFLLLPRDDYAVEDTWRATGLAGTGSNDLVVDDAFVPNHRILRIGETRGGPTPGSAVNPGHIYRLPLYAIFPFNLIGAAIGAARGALDTVAAGLAARNPTTQVSLSEQQSVQLRIAQVAAQVEVAWNALQPVREEVNRQAREGIVPDLLTRSRYRLILGQAGKLCVSAMDDLFPLLGGRGLAAGNPVQRAWRDVHAVAQHIGLTWDVQAGFYGAVKLGQPCPDPKL